MKPSVERVVLITGAAGGLGSALVTQFARDGWRVAAGWHRQTLEQGSETILPVSLDVTQSDQVDSAVAAILGRWGRLDLLINNAGVARDDILPRMSDGDWQEVLDVNLKGPFLCSRAALAVMYRQQEGQIINIVSFGGRVGRAGQANYTASKAGLMGLTQSLAREAGPHRVRVNAVSPGFLRTKLVGQLTEDDLHRHANENVLGRLNEFGEVARFLVFLAGTRNISGQLFQLDSRIAPAG